MLKQRNRGLLPDCPMWAFFVVVSAPILQFCPGVVKGEEPVRVQTLRAETSVEGFDEGIVSRLARPAEVERDAIDVGPQIEVAGDEFRSLIDTDGLRITHPVSYTHL